MCSRFPPWCHLSPFLENGDPQHCLDPPSCYSTAALSPPLPQRAEEMLCGVPCASLVAASERNDNIPVHPSWIPAFCILHPASCLPMAVLSYLSGTQAGCASADRSALLLAQLQELGGQCHPRCQWRREQKDYHGYFTLQSSKTCQPRGQYLPLVNKRGWREAVGK